VIIKAGETLGRPKKQVNNVTRVLYALSRDGAKTSEEIATDLTMKPNTVRAIISLTNQAGLTEYGAMRGTAKTFKLTDAGVKRLAQLQTEAI